MRLDDDDLYDYEQDSFDEDETIQEVVDKLKSHGVTAAQAEAELEKCDWDVEEAVAALKRKSAQQSKQLAAKSSAKQPKEVSQKDAPSQTNSSLHKDPPQSNGKLTALQMLSQKRQMSKMPIESSDTQKISNPSLTVEAESSNDTKKLGLAGLASRRRNQLSQSEITSQPRVSESVSEINLDSSQTKSSGNSAMEKLRMRQLRQRSASPSTDPAAVDFRKEAESLKSSNLKQPNAEEPQKYAISKEMSGELANSKWNPPIDYTVTSPLPALDAPSEFGALIGKQSEFFENKLNRTNQLATAINAQKGFSKPSPDDQVLQAQNAAFKPINKAEGKNSNQTNALDKPRGPRGSSKTSDKLEASAKVTAEQRYSLAVRLKSLQTKSTCSFVVIGHVDAGKSTLNGRLLLNSGALNQKIASKNEHEAAKLGKGSFWLAWAMDSTAEERERGVTVDVGEATFETESTKFVVLDAPGHKDYVPNMIAGVSQADLAVLVIDSDTNAFESGFSLDGQTKEHAILSKALGINHMVVAVNKMDTQKWDQNRFTEICDLMSEFLKKVGFSLDQLIFVPTSGITGENVTSLPTDPALKDWYDGPSLVGALESVAGKQPSTNLLNEPLRFLVSNAYVEPFQSNVTVTGRVVTGCAEAGVELQLIHSQSTTVTIKQIAGDHLVARELGEMKLQVDGSTSVKAGDVLASFDANLVASTKFQAKIRLFDVSRPVIPGTKLAFHLGRTEDTVKITKIIESIGGKAAKQPKKVRHLGKGSAALVELELNEPTVLSPPDVCKDLGRFVLRLQGSTIGGGVITSIIS